MKKLLSALILVLTLALLFTACDLLPADDDDTDGDGTVYDGEYADIYAAALEAGYTDTPEALVAAIKVRMSYLGGLDGVTATEYTLTDGILILKLSDGRSVHCGKVIYPKGSDMVSVAINTGNDEKYDSLTLPKGSPVGTLPTPVREGYKFLGWLMSGADGIRGAAAVITENVTETTPVNENVTVNARWEKIIVDDGTRPAELEKVLFAGDKSCDDYYPLHTAMISAERGALFNFCYDEKITSYTASVTGEGNPTLADVSLTEDKDGNGVVNLWLKPDGEGLYTVTVTVTDTDGNKTESVFHVRVYSGYYALEPYGMVHYVGVMVNYPDTDVIWVNTPPLTAGEETPVCFVFEGTAEGLSITATYYGYGDAPETVALALTEYDGYVYAKCNITASAQTQDINLYLEQTVNGKKLTHSFGVRASIEYSSDISVISASDEAGNELYDNGTVRIPVGYVGIITLELSSTPAYVEVKGGNISVNAKYDIIELYIESTDILPVTLNIDIYPDENSSEYVSETVTLVSKSDSSEPETPTLKDLALNSISAIGTAEVSKTERTITFNEGACTGARLVYDEYSYNDYVVKNVLIDGAAATFARDIDYFRQTNVTFGALSVGVHTMTVVFVDNTTMEFKITVVDVSTLDPGFRFSTTGSPLTDIELTEGYTDAVHIYYSSDFSVRSITADNGLQFTETHLDFEVQGGPITGVEQGSTLKSHFYFDGAAVGTYKITIAYAPKNDLSNVKYTTFNVTFTESDTEPEPEPIFLGMSVENANGVMGLYGNPILLDGSNYLIGFSEEVERVVVFLTWSKQEIFAELAPEYTYAEYTYRVYIPAFDIAELGEELTASVMVYYTPKSSGEQTFTTLEMEPK